MNRTHGDERKNDDNAKRDQQESFSGCGGAAEVLNELCAQSFRQDRETAGFSLRLSGDRPRKNAGQFLPLISPTIKTNGSC